MQPRKVNWLQRKALKQLFGTETGNRMAEDIGPISDLLAAVVADKRLDQAELYALYQTIRAWRESVRLPID